ncbi:hypothetical protein PG623_04275 [Riemerella anatipestifer]|nr:hypothetical protein [Riemerella anatipestifer]
MKTTTKLSVLAFLGLGLAVYGQSGKVGINISSPRATLDVQPNATNSEDDAKTNEGILAPKLSKTRVASIEAPVEGTLVYVIDDANKTNGTIGAYKGTDPKVAKITEKGYYYYNGMEWVKSTANSNGELWAQRNNSGVTETYLVPANTDGNIVQYNRNQFSNSLGGLTPSDFDSFDHPDDPVINRSPSPYSVLISSDLFYEKGNLPKTTYYPFNISTAVLRENAVAASATPKDNIYVANSTGLIAKDLTTSINHATGFSADMRFFSNSRTNLALGAASNVYFGSPDLTSYNPTADNVMASSHGVRNYGTVTDLSTIRSFVINKGKAENIKGIWNTLTTQSQISSVNSAIPSHKVNNVYGIENIINVSDNGTIQDKATTFRNIGHLRKDSNTPLYYGIFNSTLTYSGANVEKLYGARFVFSNDAAATVGDMYGLCIDDVSKGTTKNYAIYTGLGKVRFGDNVGIGVDIPTEKLEVDGNVKATGFIGANAAIFPDYVFQKYYTGTSSLKADYSFKTLRQVEDFVKTNGHLPGYKSAAEIKKQGYIDLMATQLTNVEKIEELYLHLLEKDKEVKELKARLEKLEVLLNK